MGSLCEGLVCCVRCLIIPLGLLQLVHRWRLERILGAKAGIMQLALIEARSRSPLFEDCLVVKLPKGLFSKLDESTFCQAGRHSALQPDSHCGAGRKSNKQGVLPSQEPG